MNELVWGVRVGSSVWVCADGPSAFREERVRRAARQEAVAVVFIAEHGGWRDVPMESPVRPDPRPPAQPRSLPWYDRLGRGGSWLGWLGSRWARNRSAFGRRRV